MIECMVCGELTGKVFSETGSATFPTYWADHTTHGCVLSRTQWVVMGHYLREAGK